MARTITCLYLLGPFPIKAYLCQYIHAEWISLVYNYHFDILDADLTSTPKLFQLLFCSETLPNILALNCTQGFAIC